MYRYVQPGYNTVEDVYPDIAKRWSSKNYLKANEVLATSSYNALWICNSCGGEHLSKSEHIAKWKCPVCHGIFNASIADVVRGIDECPYCAGKQVLSGYNSFDKSYPNLLKEWDPIRNYAIDLDPRSISDRMAREVWWICSRGHKYRMRLFRRVLFEKRGKDASYRDDKATEEQSSRTLFCCFDLYVFLHFGKK